MAGNANGGQGSGRLAIARRKHEDGGLSDRELDVVRLIAQGLSCAESAPILGITARTVKAHRMRIAERLGLRYVTAQTYRRLPAECVRRGLIDSATLFGELA